MQTHCAIATCTYAFKRSHKGKKKKARTFAEVPDQHVRIRGLLKPKVPKVWCSACVKKVKRSKDGIQCLLSAEAKALVATPAALPEEVFINVSSSTLAAASAPPRGRKRLAVEELNTAGQKRSARIAVASMMSQPPRPELTAASSVANMMNTDVVGALMLAPVSPPKLSRQSQGRKAGRCLMVRRGGCCCMMCSSLLRRGCMMPAAGWL